MENVVPLNTPFHQRSKAARQAALLRSFASHRRSGDDVFWLKENAEALNILECTGARPAPSDLEVYAAFYEDIERRMEFFPQYYRFLLSLCLDLEDLAGAGDKGQRLAEWVAREGLAQAELSDLQRGEARRLCARRGIDPLIKDAGLGDRLREFASRSDTFAMPNKKAAYELTHIVFYLSEYGRRDPDLPDAAIDSLIFAGTLAFLDFNVDLLAEICIALRHARQTPPEVWEIWLTQQTRCFSITADAAAPLGDDYHEYLMLNWFMAQSGQGGFAAQVPEGRVSFRRTRPRSGPLRELSECIYSMGRTRSGDWEAMRETVSARLSHEAHAALVAAEGASDRFGQFFAGFARVNLREVRA
ncbi:hypothetical protein G5B38_03835 [Pseudohalocynthiibacter aestuariivivens]|uniref:Iron-containing redox enzyme n=1 Tax=Roseovarius pelagicus TaxID=2980108 RepID=A0ABY6DB86_9RHOB|nr:MULTISPECIES: hypothetical protein [Rhodobacterales]QIE44725.1 hypothetical protein G5B38_03835 [Pseudohalocynthiibacter aestuariivivens]UXX83363.1 hypothetical protein N7U68_01365 [Roseovarius pelagicus]